jgi:uncharacterized membrane-anchored protein YhcB (DUF1043 family)
MIEYGIGLVVGAIVGFVIGVLVYRNNPKKFEVLYTQAQIEIALLKQQAGVK